MAPPNYQNYSQALVSTAMLTSSTSALSLMGNQHQSPTQHHPSTTVHLMTSSPAMDNGAYTSGSGGRKNSGGGVGKSSPTKNQASPSGGNDHKGRDTVKSGSVQKKTASAKGSDGRRGSTSTPAKGSRRRSSSSVMSNNDDDDDDGDENGHYNGENNSEDDGSTEQQRRRHFLERNRIAASKCRQKKKVWVQQLERRAEEVTNQNRSLHIAVAQLKEEVMILKNQLISHHNCGCSTIHQFLHTECNTSSENAVAQAMSGGFSLVSQQQQRQQHQQHQQRMVSSMANSVVNSMAAQAVAAAATAPSMLLQQQSPQHRAFPNQQQQQYSRHHHSASLDPSQTHSADLPVLLTTSPPGAAFVANSPYDANGDNSGSTPGP
ncbi:hypothetical protein LPJ66_003069 [Kickxella alabastrina]|uniref:Uncharacterized protein n=1 Tax=Kickxella alabastrina TaxID=61397 RepID=A0ACC1IKV7_9FUNG|nr:hypothetical protein LPJ66_003069 [Kickxella alabastrina]